MQPGQTLLLANDRQYLLFIPDVLLIKLLLMPAVLLIESIAVNVLSVTEVMVHQIKITTVEFVCK